VKEVVLGFDKTISIKSNKCDLRVFKEDIERRFINIKNWDGVLKCVEEIKENIAKEYKKLDEKFIQFKKTEEETVEKTVEDLLNGKFIKYEAVRNEFKKFFGQDELTFVIDNKADIKMIDMINSKKANKTDLNATEDLIGNLNDRVKHISNLLQNVTNSILPIKNTIMSFD